MRKTIKSHVAAEENMHIAVNSMEVKDIDQIVTVRKRAPGCVCP